MREPLNQFADRIVRAGELPEFLRGLMLEKGITPDEIILIASRVQEDEEDALAKKLANADSHGLESSGAGSLPFDKDFDELWLCSNLDELW